MSQAIAYPYADAQPEFGQLFEIHEGVYWVRMPLPFALDHINLWLIKDEWQGQKGWTLIDTGVNTSKVKAYWEEIFSQHLEGLPILRVVVTHMHPDHVGLAGWCCERWQAPLFMSMTDYLFTRLWIDAADDEGGGPNGRAAARFFKQHGLLDEALQTDIAQRASYFPNLVTPIPRQFHRLTNGESLQMGGHDWRIIVGYGHAPEHVALYCEALSLLISGDMVLPRISTNVSVFDYEPEGDPLGLFLHSLRDFEPLPEDTLILPSHGRPFVGLHTRLEQLHSHHRDRLQECLAACATGLTAFELLPVLFKRELDVHQLSFALGEAIAHLHRLWFQGVVRRDVDAKGCYRFYALGPV